MCAWAHGSKNRTPFKAGSASHQEGGAGEVEYSGGTRTWLGQGKVKDSTVIFSISFGPKLIEVKTLISNSGATLKLSLIHI